MGNPDNGHVVRTPDVYKGERRNERDLGTYALPVVICY